MKEYEKVYAMLGLPAEVSALALGNLRIPGDVNEQPARCYGFPPALVPIWSAPDAMIYTGYWKHWFCERLPSFVNLYVNVAYRTTEIACNPTQLFQYMILEEVTSNERVVVTQALEIQSRVLVVVRALDFNYEEYVPAMGASLK